MNSSIPVLLAFGFAYIALLLSGVWALLQGLMRFGAYAISLLGDVVFRLLTGILWIGLFTLGSNGAILGYMSGNFLAALIAVGFLRKFILQGSNAPLPPLKMAGESLPVLTFSIYTAFVFSIDGILVKHFFSDQQAGIYIAASVCARMVLIVLTPINSVSYSLMCHAQERKLAVFPLLVKTLALVFTFCISMAVAAFFLSPFIVNVSYGLPFKDASPLIPFYCFAIVPIALLISYCNYCLARRNIRFVLGLLLGTFCEFILISIFHGSLREVILTLALSGLLQFTFVVAASLPELLAKTRKV